MPKGTCIYSTKLQLELPLEEATDEKVDFLNELMDDLLGMLPDLIQQKLEDADAPLKEFRNLKLAEQDEDFGTTRYL